MLRLHYSTKKEKKICATLPVLDTLNIANNKTMPQPTDFKKGDNVTVYDLHTSVAPFAWPTACYIVDVDLDRDMYIMRKRSFTDTRTFEVGRYYPHVTKD